MKMLILSTIISSLVGALVGFGCMAFIDYSENRGSGVTELAGFAPPEELNSLEAQVSTAHAVWAQVYWLKRATLAIEQKNSTQTELGEFMRGVADILSEQKNSVELEPQVYLPHTPEP
jgi:hypothetical protein